MDGDLILMTWTALYSRANGTNWRAGGDQGRRIWEIRGGALEKILFFLERFTLSRVRRAAVVSFWLSYPDSPRDKSHPRHSANQDRFANILP